MRKVILISKKYEEMKIKKRRDEKKKTHLQRARKEYQEP